MVRLASELRKSPPTRERWAPVKAGLWVLILTTVVWALDVATGRELDFFVFYFAPIIVAAWKLDLRAGTLLSGLCTLLWYHNSGGGVLHPWPRAAWDTGIRAVAFLSVAAVAAGRRRTLQQERRLSRTDDLTGLVNRRFFRELLLQEVSRARRYGRSFTLLYLDLDDFKRINDQYGHEAGDAVLRLVAAVIRRTCRAYDVAARQGGDEFLVLLPETDAAAASIVARRLQARMAAELDAGEGGVSFSIGMVTVSRGKSTAEETLALADELMYAVKRQGKHGILHRVA